MGKNSKVLEKYCIVLVQSLSCVQVFVSPMDCRMPAFPVLHYLPEFAQILESMVLSNSLIFCHPLLLLPSMCSESDISNESILPIWCPKYWRSSVSINPSNEYAALSYFKKTGLISLLAKGLSRVFSNTAIQKHQLFSIQPFLWSSSHIHT